MNISKMLLVTAVLSAFSLDVAAKFAYTCTSTSSISNVSKTVKGVTEAGALEQAYQNCMYARTKPVSPNDNCSQNPATDCKSIK